jgi:ABC-2 type transport system ATP-binding protein
MPASDSQFIVQAQEVRKSFAGVGGAPSEAVKGVSLSLRAGSLLAIAGPDGAGKTTLLRLFAGLMKPDSGSLRVLGYELPRQAAQVQAEIGYMPQKFGLYEDMSVRENLDLYADLHGIGAEERRVRYEQLLAMTALAPFTERLAGRLSGGMKQKLGLACTLLRQPRLLILDEPTVGVDPLSRRELWQIILALVRRDALCAIVSTAYMDEAEKCNKVIIMGEGLILAEGTPDAIRALAKGRSHLLRPPQGEPPRILQSKLIDSEGVADAVPEGGLVRVVCAEGGSVPEGLVSTPVAPRLEDGFMTILAGERRKYVEVAPQHPVPAQGVEVSVRVENLVRRFGSFTAVDHVSFDVRKGEIFGLLGPNGAGKTTTFRMLCGLLPATSGRLEVGGMDLRTARADARRKLGYVAQKFSLYGQLTVMENLTFFARAYGLHGRRKAVRIDWALSLFELAPFMNAAAGQIPGGFRQRLAMACALMHEPDTLFLDEPTSGADPIARREFWRLITSLSLGGVTVIVTTHFMEEAEYCDRIVIQDSGRLLAKGTPAEVRSCARPGGCATMEDAFIAIVESSRGAKGGAAA